MTWESMISTGAAIFFGTVTLLLMVKYKRKKSLCYKIISETPLLRIEDEIKSDIKISYHDKRITDLHSLVIEISNNGNEPILEDDFKKPITFEFNREAKILKLGIVKSNPEDLQAKFEEKDNKIEITSELLNPGDKFVINFLISKYENFHINTHIVGIKKLVEYTIPTESPLRMSILFVIFGYMMIFVAFLLFQDPVFSDPLFWIFMAPLLLLNGILYSLLNKYIINKLFQK